MSRKDVVLAGILVVAVTLGYIPSAHGDDAESQRYLRMREPTTLCLLRDPTYCVELEPGRYVEETLWIELDNEFKRLQDQETRLKAENDSLRKSANEFPWLTTAIVLGVGIAAGTYIGLKF